MPITPERHTSMSFDPLHFVPEMGEPQLYELALTED